MEVTPKHIGDKGEVIAAEFLERKGYKVAHKNWRVKQYEVDIICETKTEIVFVEVKTRKTAALGAPESFVDKTKQRNLIQAANYYMQSVNADKEFRFDIVTVISNNQGQKVEHIENAFMPRW
ncbi:MAG: YraN family protein [Bacteroidetes bacterium]|nr:YraN family protein [Bacteroidota bacterium]